MAKNKATYAEPDVTHEPVIEDFMDEAPAKRTRSANKPKTRGQILGGMIDMFEAMPADTREYVLDYLSRAYPRDKGPYTLVSGTITTGAPLEFDAKNGLG